MKWKSIRDHFKKEIGLDRKLESGKITKRKKRYIYFDQLLFLKPFVLRDSASSDVGESQEGDGDGIQMQDETSEESKPIFVATAQKRKLEKDSSERLESVSSAGLEEMAEDRLGNKAFLMSLLPLLNNIPAQYVIPARCKIMEALQTFSATQFERVDLVENEIDPCESTRGVCRSSLAKRKARRV